MIKRRKKINSNQSRKGIREGRRFKSNPIFESKIWLESRQGYLGKVGTRGLDSSVVANYGNKLDPQEIDMEEGEDRCTILSRKPMSPEGCIETKRSGLRDLRFLRKGQNKRALGRIGTRG